MFTYHILERRMWPLLGSTRRLWIVISMLNWIKTGLRGFLELSFFMSNCVLYVWWRDVVRERTYQGYHTQLVSKGLKKGFILFILSEVMFFFSFFWGFFSFRLNPNSDLGFEWPPVGVIPLDPMGVPLLNTLVLLTRGIFLTGAHILIRESNKWALLLIITFTVRLGILFTYLQFIEYITCNFSFRDSSFGTSFFTITGFHGIHVILGTVFLFVTTIRIFKYHIRNSHHVGFEMAAWYWHFVDVVWLYLFVFVYCWSIE